MTWSLAFDGDKEAMRKNILKPAGKLKAKLEKISGYSKDRNAYHLFLHTLLTKAFYDNKKNKDIPIKDRMVEISKKEWLTIVPSRKYYQIKLELVKHHIIYAPPAYCNGKDKTKRATPFPKSYKIDGNYFKPQCWTEGIAIALKPAKKKKHGKLCHKMTKVLIDYPSAKKALPAVAAIRKWGKIERWLKLEQLRKFNFDNHVTVSVTGQETNKVNRLPREFRQFIIGEHMLIDCVSSSVTMLVPLVPEEERAKWSKLVKEGRFYETMLESYWTGAAYEDRQAAKDDFSKWTGGMEFVYCRDYLKHEFPLTYTKFEAINKDTKGELQREIQRIQGRIFTDYARKNSAIPMYDGLLVSVDAVDQVIKDLTVSLQGVAKFTIKNP